MKKMMKCFLSLLLVLIITSSNIATTAQAATITVTKFSDVRMGTNTTFFIDEEKNLWGCGYNGGNLVSTKTSDETTPIFIMDHVIKVDNDESVAVYVIKDDNTLWGWGSNFFGHINPAEGAKKYKTPVKIMDDVIDVACGSNFVLVLKKDHTVWGWGMSDYGQLGIAIYGQYQNEPIQVAKDVKMIDAGSYHSNIIKNDGSLWSSGKNQVGQIGNGTTTNVREFVKIMDNVKYVTSDSFNTYVIDGNNNVWGWGDNNFNRVNSSNDIKITEPYFIMSDVKQIDAGGFHCMAVKTDNTLWGWGNNSRAEIGGTQDAKEPIKVLDKVEKVSAGGVGNAALMLDHTVQVVGSNQNGHIGLGKSNGALNHTQITINAEKKLLIEELKLDRKTLTMKRGDVKKLKVTLQPQNADSKSLAWKSSNSNVVSVSSNGVITAKSKGSAVITVYTIDGTNKKATCKVTVK
ncbi:Ig-like domain-containing protein [Anaerosporobacter sp.]|uniref:Ig-like domain-containing protein n=1 Tax=Anaerosporobacter sp. TaxID=1872529 RepID=UPI00286F6001|nr:Ig-like domain-containing protein [Anaerosporobacter sp.]